MEYRTSPFFFGRPSLLVRTFFLKFLYTSKVSDALVKRGTLYIRTKYNVLGINFIVGRFRCMIYVMKSMAHVVILDYLGYSLVN